MKSHHINIFFFSLASFLRFYAYTVKLIDAAAESNKGQLFEQSSGNRYFRQATLIIEDIEPLEASDKNALYARNYRESSETSYARQCVQNPKFPTAFQCEDILLNKPSITVSLRRGEERIEHVAVRVLRDIDLLVFRAKVEPDPSAGSAAHTSLCYPMALKDAQESNTDAFGLTVPLLGNNGLEKTVDISATPSNRLLLGSEQMDREPLIKGGNSDLGVDQHSFMKQLTRSIKSGVSHWFLKCCYTIASKFQGADFESVTYDERTENQRNWEDASTQVSPGVNNVAPLKSVKGESSFHNATHQANGKANGNEGMSSLGFEREGSMVFINENHTGVYTDRILIGWRCHLADIKQSGKPSALFKDVYGLEGKDEDASKNPKVDQSNLTASLQAKQSLRGENASHPPKDTDDSTHRHQQRPFGFETKFYKRREAVRESMIQFLGESVFKSLKTLYRRTRFDFLSEDAAFDIALESRQERLEALFKQMKGEGISLGYPYKSRLRDNICEIDLVTLHQLDAQLEAHESLHRDTSWKPTSEKEREWYFSRLLNAFVDKYSQGKYKSDIAFITPDALIHSNEQHRVEEAAASVAEAPAHYKLFEALNTATVADKENTTHYDVNRMPVEKQRHNAVDKVSGVSHRKEGGATLMDEYYTRHVGTPPFTMASNGLNKQRRRWLRYSSDLEVEEVTTPDRITERAAVSSFFPTKHYLPNDPFFDRQWFLRSPCSSKPEDLNPPLPNGIGVEPPSFGINIVPTWHYSDKAASNEHLITVAVIDTGVNYAHPDLKGSMWVNEAELFGVPGYDDDGNGFIDDLYGWNFYHNNNNPMDDNGHGSHISGVIAAQRNNLEGISGICSVARIMALKVLNNNGEGDVSSALLAIHYALDKAARILINSWGGLEGAPQGSFRLLSRLLEDIVDASSTSVFVVASGNSGSDISSIPYYPASLLRDWAVTVASSDRNGSLSNFSNYGLYNVHLSAPGRSIASLWTKNGYQYASGTSMAAPMVGGTACLLLANNPDLQPQQVVDALVDSVTPIASHIGRTITAGLLNAEAALQVSALHFFSLSDQKRVALRANERVPLAVHIQTGKRNVGTYLGKIEIVYLRNAPLAQKYERIITSIPVKLEIFDW